jgi:GntR family transcriptional regulator
MDKTQITHNSPMPLYQQVKQLVLRAIESGSLTPNNGLPSERELVELLGVSRITIRQALTELVQQGILYTTPSKGFFVAEKQNPYELNALLSFSALAAQRGQDSSSDVIEAAIIPASAPMARQLLVTTGSEVVSILRLRKLDNVPVMLNQSWLPHVCCPDILNNDFALASLYKILKDDYQLRLAHASSTISARLASHQECLWLDLEDPGVVLTMEQLTYSQDERPIELSLIIINPLRYRLSLEHSDLGVTMEPNTAFR